MAKKPKKQPMTLTQAQLKKIKAECTEEAIQTVLGMAYLTLHSEFGFGQERLARFRLGIEKASDYINNGTISVKDMQRFMENDLKFDSRLWEV